MDHNKNIRNMSVIAHVDHVSVRKVARWRDRRDARVAVFSRMGKQ